MKYFHLLLFLFILSSAISQNNTNKELRVFIDCNTCNKEVIRQELGNVSFVRDQKDADIHLFFITQQNANGGKHYEIEFIGQQDFNTLNQELQFDTNSDMTEPEVTTQIIKYIQLGLIPFWIKNGEVDKISLNIKTEKKKTEEQIIDKWNKWSFNLGMNGWFNGQESNSFHNLNISVSGQQVKEENKFKFSLGLSQNKSTFQYGTEEIVSEKKSSYLYLSDIKSINQHWSAGIFYNMGSSLYRNYKVYFASKPGVEYNIFPYSESSKKELKLQYKIGVLWNFYHENTIFNKTTEFLFEHSISASTSLRKKWGNISAEVEYQNLLHDFSLNEMRVHLNTNVRIFKGLSLRLYGSYGITHNQINIRAEGASLEELLLQQKQIKSGYNYYGSLGLNYSFGSIYNNIINPRFD